MLLWTWIDYTFPISPKDGYDGTHRMKVIYGCEWRPYEILWNSDSIQATEKWHWRFCSHSAPGVRQFHPFSPRQTLLELIRRVTGSCKHSNTHTCLTHIWTDKHSRQHTHTETHKYTNTQQWSTHSSARTIVRALLCVLHCCVFVYLCVSVCVCWRECLSVHICVRHVCVFECLQEPVTRLMSSKSVCRGLKGWNWRTPGAEWEQNRQCHFSVAWMESEFHRIS